MPINREYKITHKSTVNLHKKPLESQILVIEKIKSRILRDWNLIFQKNREILRDFLKTGKIQFLRMCRRHAKDFYTILHKFPLIARPATLPPLKLSSGQSYFHKIGERYLRIPCRIWRGNMWAIDHQHRKRLISRTCHRFGAIRTRELLPVHLDDSFLVSCLTVGCGSFF